MQEKIEKLLPWNSPAVAIGSIVLVIMIIYARVLGFEYVWDDSNIFYRHIAPLLDGTFDLSKFDRSFFGKYYRPFVILTFYLDVYIAGYTPGFSHGVNLALFILNALLVFAICKRIAEGTGRAFPTGHAFFAALLYAIHPVMIETAAWISGRFDLLATFFILSATLVYLGSSRKYPKVAWVSLLAFLGLLCKEIAVVFPVIIMCVWLSMQSSEQRLTDSGLRGLRENKWFLASWMLIFAVYLTLRYRAYSILEYSSMPTIENFIDDSWMRILLPLETLKFYFIQTAFPFYNISVRHPLEALSLWSTSSIIGNTITLAIIITVFYFSRRSSIAWIFIAGLTCLLPVLHFIPLSTGTNIGHERFLTAPLAFWVIFVALVRYDQVSVFLKKYFSYLRTISVRRIAWLLASGWIFLAFSTTFMMVSFWHDNFSLWSWTYKLYPNDKQSQNEYLAAAFRRDLFVIVEEEIQKIMAEPGVSVSELTPDLQATYGKILLEKREPSCLPYLEENIKSRSEFHAHETESLTEARAHISESEAQLVIFTYLSYSRAVFIFRKDTVKALELNEIARWYSGITPKLIWTELEYNHIAYLYAAGKFNEADALYESLEPSDREEARKIVFPSLGYYCRDLTQEHCKALLERGTLTPEDLFVEGSNAVKNDKIFPYTKLREKF
jgi:hypothetical protein